MKRNGAVVLRVMDKEIILGSAELEIDWGVISFNNTNHGIRSIEIRKLNICDKGIIFEEKS